MLLLLTKSTSYDGNYSDFFYDTSTYNWCRTSSKSKPFYIRTDGPDWKLSNIKLLQRRKESNSVKGLTQINKNLGVFVSFILYRGGFH